MVGQPPKTRWVKAKVRGKDLELENQTDPRDTHLCGYVLAYFFAPQGKSAARCAIGAVPSNRWSVGDLRFALRETEIGSYLFIEWAGQKSPNKAVLSQALVTLAPMRRFPSQENSETQTQQR